MNDKWIDLRRVIEDLENGFTEIDDIHSVDVRIDSVVSKLDDVGLSINEAGSEANAAIEKLMEYSEAVSYGESLLDGADLDDANHQLKILFKKLSSWLQEKMRTSAE